MYRSYIIIGFHMCSWTVKVEVEDRKYIFPDVDRLVRTIVLSIVCIDNGEGGFYVQYK